MHNHCYKSAWAFTHTLASNTNICSIASKMNGHRLLILINTSCMISYFLASTFSAKSVGNNYFKSAKYHQNDVNHKCFQLSIQT